MRISPNDICMNPGCGHPRWRHWVKSYVYGNRTGQHYRHCYVCKDVHICKRFNRGLKNEQGRRSKLNDPNVQRRIRNS